MINRTAVKAVLLDHNYCAPTSFGEEITKTKAPFIMADDGETLSWEEELGIQFEPPSLQSQQQSSALSPSHSVDSGFDSDLHLFRDLEYLDLEDIENIISGDVKGSTTSQTLLMKKTSSTNTATCTTTMPSTSTSLSSATLSKRSTVKQKNMEEPTDEEKNRKNAVAARENRLKKKRYIESIEKENEELKAENEILKTRDKNHSTTVEKLENEVAYLRNVINNHTTLSALLKSVVSTPGITFTSSLANQIPTQESTPAMDDCNNDAVDDDDRRYKTRGSRKRSLEAISPSSTKKPRKEVKGGVCLHVSQDKVSLELCNQCSIKAHGNGHE